MTGGQWDTATETFVVLLSGSVDTFYKFIQRLILHLVSHKWCVSMYCDGADEISQTSQKVSSICAAARVTIYCTTWCWHDDEGSLCTGPLQASGALDPAPLSQLPALLGLHPDPRMMVVGSPLAHHQPVTDCPPDPQMMAEHPQAGGSRQLGVESHLLVEGPTPLRLGWWPMLMQLKSKDRRRWRHSRHSASRPERAWKKRNGA